MDHHFMLSYNPPAVKEICGVIPKNSLAVRFLENWFYMFQSFKGKQYLGVFKAETYKTGW